MTDASIYQSSLTVLGREKKKRTIRASVTERERQLTSLGNHPGVPLHFGDPWNHTIHNFSKEMVEQTTEEIKNHVMLKAATYYLYLFSHFQFVQDVLSHRIVT